MRCVVRGTTCKTTSSLYFVGRLTRIKRTRYVRSQGDARNAILLAHGIRVAPPNHAAGKRLVMGRGRAGRPTRMTYILYPYRPYVRVVCERIQGVPEDGSDRADGH